MAAPGKVTVDVEFVLWCPLCASVPSEDIGSRLTEGKCQIHGDITRLLEDAERRAEIREDA